MHCFSNTDWPTKTMSGVFTKASHQAVYAGIDPDIDLQIACHGIVIAQPVELRIIDAVKPVFLVFEHGGEHPARRTKVEIAQRLMIDGKHQRVKRRLADLEPVRCLRLPLIAVPHHRDRRLQRVT